MVSRKLMPGLLALGLIAIGTGPVSAQPARSTAQGAMSAFPCPTGDASCGNGVKKKVKHRASTAQNDLPDSNPNQKIEGASGPVDEGVTRDLQEMNRTGGAHPVNRPK